MGERVERPVVVNVRVDAECSFNALSLSSQMPSDAPCSVPQPHGGYLVILTEWFSTSEIIVFIREYTHARELQLPHRGKTVSQLLQQACSIDVRSSQSHRQAPKPKTDFKSQLEVLSEAAVLRVTSGASMTCLSYSAIRAGSISTGGGKVVGDSTKTRLGSPTSLRASHCQFQTRLLQLNRFFWERVCYVVCVCAVIPGVKD